MKKIKIAVVDTGCSTNLIKKTRNVVYKKELQLEENKNNINDIEDYIGHGTMCIKNILHNLSDFEDRIIIYPIKIFDFFGRTSSIKLVDILEKISKEDVDIVNISLSTTNQEVKPRFEKICSVIENQNKLIIASKALKGDDKGELSLPAILKSIIGVTGLEYLSDNQFYLYENNKIDLAFNSKKYLYTVNKKIDNFGLNSRATSLATIFITKLIIKEQIKEISKVKIMSYLALNNNRVENYENEKERLLKVDRITFKKIKMILEKYDNTQGVYYSSSGEIISSLCYDDELIIKFIEDIQREFKIKINLKECSINEICNIFELIKIINRF